VRFTLESLPGRTYAGVVESKRLMPSVQDNVVSYKVIINVENQDGSLLPGMTCSVEFIEERNENILTVPNAALRYTPTTLGAQEIADKVFYAGIRDLDEGQKAAAIAQRAEAQKAAQAAGANSTTTSQTGLAGMLMPGGGRMRPPGGGQTAARAGTTTGRARSETLTPPKPLWYLDESGKPDCILVRSGISNGSLTEVRIAGRPEAAGDAALEGKQIILRERVQ
jgi:HlyD family secretion protein